VRVVRASFAVAVVLWVGSCGGETIERGSLDASPPLAPLTPRDPDRISDEQRQAIADLAASASAEAPAAHHGSHGHQDTGLTTTVPLTTTEREQFEREWAVAVDRVPALDTPEEASAAGYVRAAVQGAGVGVHWVNWTLIDKPFNPTRPAMLLFDERGGRRDLVGFSYWLRAEAPEGFAGRNDVWHRHTNLCIVNGWVDREMTQSAASCAGDMLAGSDLWMLHAWVVPAWDNRWGQFATLHPALCPAMTEAPDIGRCQAI